ncbi:MAG TPA: hypothetical protein PLC80_07745 [Draconibacterium sp.]|nr:hypothetical protein [Draconibacterium sp.]
MAPIAGNTERKCFVIMGFGIKTDFATGRKLDLNKSYKLLIKPVVENKGLKCIRADEILHSGSIDYQMYNELYNADLVIADLSTANVNAFYELGIRHAFKKRITIVISEDKFAYPFDLNHVKITSYTHLGEAIDYEEVLRFQKVLGETIDAVLDKEDSDSPIYTYLHELAPPLFQNQLSINIESANKSDDETRFQKGKENDTDGFEEETLIKPVIDNPTFGFLIDQAEDALHERNYPTAKALFQAALALMPGESKIDPYIIQRLAFTTYKTRLPDEITALNDAIALLSKLDIERTNDTETVSLAGRIEKELFERGQGVEHLAKSIEFYQRGYFLLHNRYHGLNLAFLFNKRVDSFEHYTLEDKIADMVFASRIRRQVLKMCEKDWNEIIERKNRIASKAESGNITNMSNFNEAEENQEMFWIQVNKAECHYGLGEMEEFNEALTAAKKIDHTDWMMKAFDKQHDEMEALMTKHGHLLNPPWKKG